MHNIANVEVRLKWHIIFTTSYFLENKAFTTDYALKALTVKAKLKDQAI